MWPVQGRCPHAAHAVDLQIWEPSVELGEADEAVEHHWDAAEAHVMALLGRVCNLPSGLSCFFVSSRVNKCSQIRNHTFNCVLSFAGSILCPAHANPCHVRRKPVFGAATLFHSSNANWSLLMNVNLACVCYFIGDYKWKTSHNIHGNSLEGFGSDR